MVKRAKKTFDIILNVMAVLGGVLLVLNMLFVCTDALGRYFFNSPLIWVVELSEYSLLYITFLGTAWLLRREGHVAVEIVIDKLQDRKQYVMGIINSFIGALMSAAVAWYGLLLTIDYSKRGFYDASLLEIPKAPIIAIIPLGCFLLLIQFLIRGHDFYGKLKEISK